MVTTMLQMPWFVVWYIKLETGWISKDNFTQGFVTKFYVKATDVL